MPDDEKPVTVGNTYFTDLDYCVEYEVFEYRIEFVVLRTATSRNVETDETTTHYMGNYGPTNDRTEANVYLRGHVKWDGCSNWDFCTHECMMHFCEREDMVAVGELLGRLYDMSKMVPHWSR